MHIPTFFCTFAPDFKSPTMKHIYKFTHLLICTFLLASCTCEQHDPILDKLDEALAMSDTYLAEKAERIDHLRLIYNACETADTRYRYAEQLYHEFNGFSADSAIYYAGLCTEHSRTPMQHQRAAIYTAQNLAIQGQYASAFRILSSLHGNLDSTNCADYFRALNLTYVWQSQFSTIPEEQAFARSQIPVMRDSIRAYVTDPIWLAQETALTLFEQGQAQQAIDLLEPILQSLPEGSDYIRYLANSLGSCYSQSGNEDMALHYFAISAINDIQLSVMEHSSLREVALILFRRGDIERAYTYMNRCVLDAQFCKARLRTIEMANDMPFIQSAYRASLQQKQQRLTYTAIALFIGLILMTISSFVAYKMMRQSRRSRRQAIEATRQLKKNNIQLQQALAQLQTTNDELTQSNRIRAAYVIQYMTECSQGIERADQYNKSLLRIALQGDWKKLFEAIKSNDFIDQSYRDFYQHFDETFLSLFPHFIDDLNELLQPDMRFQKSDKPVLNTELRILALIRLGITDTEDIARFLRHSVKTIYNYRTKNRGRAIGDRDLFEQKVQML